MDWCGPALGWRRRGEGGRAGLDTHRAVRCTPASPVTGRDPPSWTGRAARGLDALGGGTPCSPGGGCCAPTHQAERFQCPHPQQEVFKNPHTQIPGSPRLRWPAARTRTLRARPWVNMWDAGSRAPHAGHHGERALDRDRGGGWPGPPPAPPPRPSTPPCRGSVNHGLCHSCATWQHPPRGSRTPGTARRGRRRARAEAGGAARSLQRFGFCFFLLPPPSAPRTNN